MPKPKPQWSRASPGSPQRRAIEARDAVLGNTMSVRLAAFKFGLSKGTVQRLVSDKLSPSRVGTTGRKTLLPPTVENFMVDFLIRVSDSYLGVTPQQVKKIAGYYLWKMGKKEEDYEMSDSWFQDFMRRHSSRISSLKPRTISASRTEGFNELALAQWYAFVEPIIAQYKASEVFNNDSAGIEVEKGAAKVIGRRGAAQPRVVATVKSGHIDMSLCISAQGPMMDPFFCFKGELAVHNMAKGVRATWMMTEKGWATTASHLAWARLFVEHLKKNGIKKALLFVDNADLHIDPEVFLLFKENNVRCIGLIPGTTHDCQPCDNGLIGAIKKMIKPTADMLKTPLTQTNVAFIIQAACDELQRRRRNEGTHIGAHAFRVTGIWPFSRAVFESSRFAASRARLGLNDPAVRAAAIAEAEARGKAMSAAAPELLLEEGFCAWAPDSAEALGALASAAGAKRLAKLKDKLTPLKADGTFDARTAAGAVAWTSEAWVENETGKKANEEMKKAEQKKKAEDADRAKLQRAKDQEEKKEKAAADRIKKREEREKAEKDGKAAQAARKAARKAESEAARVAALAAKAPSAKKQRVEAPRAEAPHAGGKRKREEAAGDNAYARQYKKK